MRRSSWFAFVLPLLLVAATLSGMSAASAGEKLPVPWWFVPSAVVGAVQGDLPGANDWDCTPTARHPRPVVLVHGTFATANDNWQTYAPLLANHGYCVFALDYGADPSGLPPGSYLGGLARMQDGAAQLKKFVARVVRETGAPKVDLIGHSQGTLMPNYYVKFLGGAPFVKRYISIAPLWHGTQVAAAAALFAPIFGNADESTPVCVACGQFPPGSRFMKKMRRGGVAVDGVEYTNIITRYDELVVPYTSGIEPGMRNHVVQDICPTDFSDHLEIVADPVAAGLVLNALDPERRRPVPCTVVLPAIGTPGMP